MQAFPEHRAVRIPATAGQALFLGHEGRFETSMSPEVRFSAQCAVVWLLPGDRRPPGSPPATAGAAEWPTLLRPPLRLVLSERFTLVVDP
jgi:hypothetical protein